MIYGPRQITNHDRLIRQKNQWMQSDLAKKFGIKRSSLARLQK
jgi:HTH-type transcriptional regulator/antitoxin HipB